MTADNEKTSSAEIKHVVLLLHGIRDHAAWQDVVAEQLRDNETEVIGIKYGYFDVFSFLAPFGASHGPMRRVSRKLREAFSEYRGAKFSVIAHSFGTYLLTQYLLENSDVEFHRVILCGSVVRQDFHWGLIKQRIGEGADGHTKDSLINECGSSDIWPALAMAAGWGYGNAGTDGFGDPLVTDRFHTGGHSLYFRPEFIAKYWTPFLREGKIERGQGKQGREIPTYIRILSLLPLRWVTPIGLVCILAAVFYPLGWLGNATFAAPAIADSPPPELATDESANSSVSWSAAVGVALAVFSVWLAYRAARNRTRRTKQRRLRKKSNWFLGVICALLCVILWSLGFTSLRWASGSADPLEANVVLLGVASLFYLALAAFAKPLERVFGLTESDVPSNEQGLFSLSFANIAVLVGNIGSFLLFIYAVEHISAFQAISVQKGDITECRVL